MVENKTPFEMYFTSGMPLAQSPYPGLDSKTFILEKGSIQKEGAMPLEADILVEQDAQVPLRDDVKIRVDIFRSTKEGKYPTIMWYAPYGKRGSVLSMDNFGHPTRMDVKPEWEDGLNAFEAPNPSYWVARGYVVVSPDPRGVGSSEGNVYAWGSQQAKDEYDVIEWIATQDWSNGKVGLTGTSYLSMSQYAVAELQPPHLAAIAPWEGAFNPYKDTLARGGVSDTSFNQSLSRMIYTDGLVEDMARLSAEHPFYDAYWQDKTPNLEKVTIPTYLVGSWTNAIHSSGPYQAYKQLPTKEKWLRVHNTHEWTDYYNPENVADLQKFFDHYLKGEENGWEKTPHLRYAVLNPGHEDKFQTSPNFLENQSFTTYYLVEENGKLKLSETPQAVESQIVYDTTELDGITFELEMREAVDFIGNFSLRLWVESVGNDDMDLFAFVRKYNQEGQILEHELVTERYYPGPNGRLRVSQRSLDKEKSTELTPVLCQTKEEKIGEGDIVSVEIPFWPFAMRWEKGEKLALTVCPVDKIVRPEFPQLPPSPNVNKGKHVIHFGGKYDSKLRVPKEA